MRLTSFRVKKYRSIEDSGEIRVDENVTTFVGINESGKTNVMRALRKINNAHDTRFDELTENPLWHFGEFDPNEIFITATFKLNDTEKEHVKSIHNGKTLDKIKISKKKNLELICHLESDQEAIPFASFSANYLQPIINILNDLNNGIQKKSLIAAFKEIGKGSELELNVRQPEPLNNIKAAIGNFRRRVPTIPDSEKQTKVGHLLEKINAEVIEDPAEKVKNYLIGRLPRFIYFENIGIIDSRIYLPSFISKLDSGALDEDELTAKTLLDLGKLDPHELLDLSKEGNDREQVRQNKDRLSQKLRLASKKVSEEIDKIWTSNDHDIEFEVQGHDLRVWVINKHDRAKLQLEERSRGYQWYFSFYTVFNVESERRHKDAVLLLDEPALFLHAKGQEDFLAKTLPKLVEKNQILYTTHSPSMIDLSRPDSIHTVTLKEKIVDDTTQKVSHISDEVWDSDRNALFPLQAALHYTMVQSMFIGKKNLIVEGLTDYWLLKSASNLLEAAGKKHLRNDFVFVPAGGGTKSVLFATTYKSQDLDVAVLLDADKEGRDTLDQIVKNKTLRKKNVLLLNEIFAKRENMSIEDIFPQDYYLKFVKSTYKKELDSKGIPDINLASQDPMIVKRIDEFFKSNDLGEFHKSRPDKAILNELSNIDISSLPPELVKNFETAFEEINKMLQ